MQPRNRRDDDRIPAQIFFNQYVRDRLHRAVTTNLSPTGLYVHRVYGARNRPLTLGRDDRFVQIELPLPGTSDTIWARGEIRYDDLGLDGFVGGAGAPMVHGTGIQLVDMARGHQKLLREYVIDRKRQRLQQILTLIRKNRYQ
ncbi:MAG TPA: PilZ domain-containing protein [Polyangia bacterium]|jgi:hypothetical protein